MSKNSQPNILFKYSLYIFLLLCIYSSCSNKKNTVLTRTYHSINTKYNIYFNAEEAYKEALNNKIEKQDDNLSENLYIYPYDPDASEKILIHDQDTSYIENSTSKKENIFSSTLSSFLGSSLNNNSSESFNPLSKSNSLEGFSSSGGGFTRTVDKCTKAIKLHSIKTKPRKDRAKRNNENFKAWWQQQEFNPYMKNVWILLGKAELQNENYMQSISTFMYTTKIYSTNPEIVAECQLWIARGYTEIGWMYEAGDVLYRLDANGGVPEKLQGLYASVYANYLMRNNEYEKAIPYMDLAIRNEKNKIQKLRLKYILGQLYAQAGDNVNAYNAFGKVQGMNTPYRFSVNARINQLALDDIKPKKEIISKLKKYTKGNKNENYLDKVYYTIGNIYLHDQDTTNAVKNYQLAISESKEGGYDKILSQIRLGGLYYDKHEFILAQPCYSGALEGLKKTNEHYQLVSFRSAILDELVIPFRVIREQDSLQYLANLPEEQRLSIINERIQVLKDEEKAKQHEEEYQERFDKQTEQSSFDWDDLGNQSLFQKQPSQNLNQPFTFQNADNSSAFYFYNTQTVKQGKVSFQKQWGNRKLEDNWRRKDKSGSEIGHYFTDDNDSFVENDSILDFNNQDKSQFENDIDYQNSNAKDEADIYSVDYYLQQLPLTDEKIEQSNVLIEDALFKMGNIYKEKLEDLQLARQTFELDLERFPETPNKEEIYYQLFLIYMQLDDKNMMAMYRNKLLTEFSDNKYAMMLSEPDYEWNLKNLHLLQDSLYEATYEAYLDSDIKTVRDNFNSILKKYPFSSIMPKFQLLNTLTYVQTKDLKSLKNGLEDIVRDYPESDVAELANDMLSHIKDGRVLLSDGTPIRGMKWNISDEDEEGAILDEKELQFADDQDSNYMLLLFYKSKTIDRNKLLYQVADYNFSNYVIQTFDLNFEQDPPLEMLQIKGFKKFSNIRSYLRRAFEADGLIQQIDPTILMIPISVENSKILMVKGLDDYISFYKEHYGKETPQLIAYWGGDKPVIEELEDLEEVTSNEVNEEIKIEETDNYKDVSEEVTLTIKPPLNDKENKDVKKLPLKIEEDKGSDSTINARDIFDQDQVDIIESAGEVLNNPVDGIKNLFNKYKNRTKLTKEEKEALKEERRLVKERQKELKTIEKSRQDSIKREEKAIQESINQIERDRLEVQKRIEEEQKRVEKEKQDAIKAKAKVKEDARKQKERERQELKRAQNEKRKEQEYQKENRRREQERNRKKRRKEQDKLRKEKERPQK